MEAVSGTSSRLLKCDASRPVCDGYVREKDAGSANSSAIGATEDELSRRPVRSGGRGFAFSSLLDVFCLLAAGITKARQKSRDAGPAPSRLEHAAGDEPWLVRSGKELSVSDW